MKKSSSLKFSNHHQQQLQPPHRLKPLQLPPKKVVIETKLVHTLDYSSSHPHTTLIKKSILKKPITMTKSYNFSISNALDYTCSRMSSDEKSLANFCGQCNSCQVITYLNNLKHWFDRASHITLKKFLIGLVTRVNNIKIYKYLNDLLKPLTDSKDFVYARNKFIPSCDEDHLKATNNRCLDGDYINKQINLVWSWYSNSNNYIKLNFMLSLLKKCDQALVSAIILQVKSILDSTQARINDIINTDDDDLDEFKINENADDQDEPEIICEALDDDEDDTHHHDHDDDDDVQLRKDDEEVKKIFTSQTRPAYSMRGVKQVDFIRLLPVHLSKSILSGLDTKSLYNCLLVCKYWCNIIKEVRKESVLQKVLQDDMMLLKGTSSKGSNPCYANNVDIRVPNLYPGTYECKKNDFEKEINVQFKSECNWSNAYAGFLTRNIIVEERNCFCGSYNVLLLKEKRDEARVIHLNGTNVAYASMDKKIRFIDLKTSAERLSTVQGHSGTIKCIYICESRGILITGSYDTSIRCWSIETGKCLSIFQGHQQTINCLSMYDEYGRIISGSSDKTCKVWNLNKKKCWRTFKHSYPVVAVAIGDEICVSGGLTGKLKVFHLLSGQLIKAISAHSAAVTAIKFDRWHILSGSLDGYALLFSTQGKHKKCIMAMRHPKEVMCLEFQYLRAITGSADGKIRIWNVLNGDCIRVMRGNSRCDPILSMSIIDNRILMNTENNIILMEFEAVQYEYGSNREETSESVALHEERPMYKKQQKQFYSTKRACRMELVQTPNTKLFNDDRKAAMSHSSRPLSNKNLRDAHLIHTILSTKDNNQLIVNSAGHVSETALVKRRSVMQSINAILTSHCSSSASSAFSYAKPTTAELVTPLNYYAPSGEKENQNLPHRKVEINDEFDKSLNNVSNDTSSQAKIPTNLDETKQFLREQLKEIKQANQKQDEINFAKLKQIKDDSKSCYDTASINRHKMSSNSSNADDYANMLSGLTSSLRVLSARPTFDTKTKIRLKAQDLTNMKLASTKATSEEDLIKNDPYNAGKKSTLTSVNTQTLVTKVFESQEADLKTKNMYPMHVKTKIPNPKIIRPQTVPSKLITDNFVPNYINNTATNSLPPPVANSNDDDDLGGFDTAPTGATASNKKIARSKSAAPGARLVPKNAQRPKTGKQTTFNSTSFIEPLEFNILSPANDHLNLKTYKEIDKIVDIISSGLNEPEKVVKEKLQEKEDIYKKFWLLKSTGQYHGSLLAKPKVTAPEIRE